MKNARLFCLLVAVLTLSGCFTTDPTTGQRVPDVERNKAIVALAQSQISSAVTLEVKRHPNARPYLEEVAAVFCKAKADGVFSLTRITDEVNKIPKVASLPPEAVIAKNTILGSFAIILAGKTDLALSPDKWGGMTVGLVCDSLTVGLHDAG